MRSNGKYAIALLECMVFLAAKIEVVFKDKDECVNNIEIDRNISFPVPDDRSYNQLTE